MITGLNYIAINTGLRGNIYCLMECICPNCCIDDKFAWNHLAAYGKLFLALPESSWQKNLLHEQVFLTNFRCPFKYFTPENLERLSYDAAPRYFSRFLFCFCFVFCFLFVFFFASVAFARVQMEPRYQLFVASISMRVFLGPNTSGICRYLGFVGLVSTKTFIARCCCTIEQLIL